MTSLYRIAPVALIISALSFSAIASEDGHPERVKHYDFEKPTTSAQAQTLYNKSMDEIAIVLDKESLNTSDMEEVHRISYALEAAVEAFEEKHTFDKKLTDEVEENVEELHEASEDHKEADTRKWFTKLAKMTPQLK